MSAFLTIAAEEEVFFKQAEQMLPKAVLQMGIARLYPGEDFPKDTKIIVTDGKNISVYGYKNMDYDFPVPVLTIAENLPDGIENSLYSRLYKRQEFSHREFSSDVEQWTKIIVDRDIILSQRDIASHSYNVSKQKTNEYKNALEQAALIQQKIMSEKPFAQDFEIEILYQGKSKVSGDFFLMEDLGDRVLAVIGDVTDHGYFSGIYGASIYSAIRSFIATAPKYALDIINLANFIQYASRFYHVRDDFPDMDMDNLSSAELTICEIDKVHKKVRFLPMGSGNEPPIIIHKGKASFIDYLAEDITIGLPIGEGSQKSPSGKDIIERANFKRGDCIVLYTDGITEIFNVPEEEKKDNENTYSKERLLSSVEHELKKEDWNPGTIIRGISLDAASYSTENTKINNKKQIPGAKDDVTVVCIRWEKTET